MISGIQAVAIIREMIRIMSRPTYEWISIQETVLRKDEVKTVYPIPFHILTSIAQLTLFHHI